MKNFFQQKISKKMMSGIFAFAMIFQGLFFYGLDFANANDTIPPVAEELRFFDNNGNNKIDTIYIKFNENLTGTFHGNYFGLDSNTGGLSESDVKYSESKTNLNKHGTIIQSNILKIVFDEYDKTGTGLIVNTSSAGDSQLRVKTYVGIGITDLSGNEINFGLSDLIEKSTYGTFEEVGCSGDSCTSVKIEKNIIGFNGKSLKIPLIAKNFSNIGGLELKFEYDNSQLNCTGIESEILNGTGDLKVENNQGEGWISTVWDYANDSVLGFGSGKLLDLDCDVIGNAGDGSNLNLSITELGDGNGDNLSSNVNDLKTFFIQENISIGGKILNPDGSVFLGGNMILENKSVSENNIFTKISNNVGFLFGYLFKNQNYELKASVNPDYTENTVGDSDILKIQKDIIKNQEFTSGYDCAAADVNGDGKISVLDIIKIRRYLALNKDLPSGNFKFYNGNISCDNLGNLSEKVDFNNFSTSTGNIIFTKIRMGNVEN